MIQRDSEMCSAKDLTSLWERNARRTIAGAGSVSCADGRTRWGRLRLWQLWNGNLVVELQTREELQCKSQFEFQGNRLQDGTLVENWHVEATGIRINRSFAPVEDGESWRHYGIVRQWATTYHFDFQETRPECREVQCDLTNLVLDDSVMLDLDGIHVELRGKSEMSRAYSRARALKSCAILGELRATSGDSVPDTEWDKLVGRLCLLLSLSQRNYVRQAFRSGSREVGGDCCSQAFYGYGAQTTRAAKRPLITTEYLGEYLRQTAAKVDNVFRRWKLVMALDHYLRAMDSVSAWPMGIGIVVALECLVSAYAEDKHDDLIFCERMEDFQPVVAELVWPILADCFPHRAELLCRDRSEFRSWKMGIRSLNRRSFKRKMRSMLIHLGIDAPASSLLQSFVYLRNDLVHYGYPVSEKWDREFGKIIQMADFLEQIFLAVLGYTGPSQERRVHIDRTE